MSRRRGSKVYWTVPRIVRAVVLESQRRGRTVNAREIQEAHRAGRNVPNVRTVYDRGLSLKQVYRLGNLPDPPDRRFVPRSHCKHGHPLTPENVYVWTNGSRRCRECHRINRRRWNVRNPRPLAKQVVPIDPEKAARITAEKARYWGLSA